MLKYLKILLKIGLNVYIWKKIIWHHSSFGLHRKTILESFLSVSYHDNVYDRGNDIIPTFVQVMILLLACHRVSKNVE